MQTDRPVPAFHTPTLPARVKRTTVQHTTVQRTPIPPRVAVKRYSLRLPLRIAAPLEALCELHPSRKRGQIITDLLALALEQLERPAPGATIPESGFQPDLRQHVYLLGGPFAEFRGLVQKHHRSMERELGKVREENEIPTDDYSLDTND